MLSGLRPYGIDRDKPCKLIDAQEIAADRAADRATYLAKFPDAEPITALGDFAFFRLEITGSRLVSGFGRAINLTARTLPSLLAVGTPVAGDFPTN